MAVVKAVNVAEVAGPDEQALLDRIVRDVADGPVASAAVHLRRGEVVLLDAVVGAPLDARFLPYSVTKGVVNAAVATLVDDGTLRLGALVSEVVPWFVGDGKECVTIEHLLLHTAGLATAPMRPAEGVDPVARRARMARWRATRVPGSSTQYHPTAAHWVLALVVEEVTGVTVKDLVRDRVAGPLGLEDLSLGADPGDARIQLPHAVGEATPEAVVAQLRAAGIDLEAMVGEAAHRHLLRLAEPELLAVGVPGGGLVSSARSVAMVLEALATGTGELWSTAIRAAFTHEVRNVRHDATVGGPANRSLGFLVSGDDGLATMRGLPSGLGPRVFGQFGSGGHLSWADPDSGLAFCSVSSSLHRDPLWWFAQMAEVNRLAAACA